MCDVLPPHPSFAPCFNFHLVFPSVPSPSNTNLTKIETKDLSGLRLPPPTPPLPQ